MGNSRVYHSVTLCHIIYMRNSSFSGSDRENGLSGFKQTAPANSLSSAGRATSTKFKQFYLPAVNNDWARSAPVALVDLSATKAKGESVMLLRARRHKVFKRKCCDVKLRFSLAE